MNPKYECDYTAYMQGGSANQKETPENVTDNSTATGSQPPSSDSGEKGYGSRLLNYVKVTFKGGASDAQPKVTIKQQGGVSPDQVTIVLDLYQWRKKMF